MQYEKKNVKKVTVIIENDDRVMCCVDVSQAVAAGFVMGIWWSVV